MVNIAWNQEIYIFSQNEISTYLYQNICYKDCLNSAKGARDGGLKSGDYKLTY